VLLYRWQGAARNFGDELNMLLWPRLLPGFFDDDPSEVFLGIGSILDARHPQAALKLVAGAGYGGYEPPPALDARWMLHWVRGPRTARRLGLHPGLGLGDPAMLLPVAGWAVTNPASPGVAFMPHFESLGRGPWRAAAAMAGIGLIDPRDDPAAVISAIGSCRLLLSEALHGVIVADALRVPWIALRPLAAVHRAKWLDWADTLSLSVEFRRLVPSSLLERLQVSPLSAFRRFRHLLDAVSPLLARLARRRFLERAAQSLAIAAAAPPQLSAAAALAGCQSRMLERLDAVRRHPRRA
jgi:succinoglycan biosynthesis protein ExoV